MRQNRTLVIFLVVAASMVHSVPVRAQSVIYLPSSSNRENWVCLDQFNNPIPYAGFDVYNGYYTATNYHWHDSPSHPFSAASPNYGYADGNGNFSFNVNPTLVGQAELEQVYCSNGNGYAWGSQAFWVGYTDIYFNDHPESYLHIGGNTTGHGGNDGNHWMYWWAAYGYWYAVNDYIAQYNSGRPVCANDMALPYGEKFDINQTWTSPHASHDRGTAVDTATTTNQCPSANVVTNPTAFLNACVQKSAVPYPVSQIDPGDVHCNWFNPSTYPH